MISVLSKWVTSGSSPSYGSGSHQRFSGCGPFHFFDFTKLAEVYLRPRQHAGIPPPVAAGAASARLIASFSKPERLRAGYDLYGQCPSLSQVNAKFACQTADQRSRVNVRSFSANSDLPSAFAAGAAAGVQLLLPEPALPLPVSQELPQRCAFNFEDHNQRASFHFIAKLTFSSFTTPANGAGTSIDAYRLLR